MEISRQRRKGPPVVQMLAWAGILRRLALPGPRCVEPSSIGSLSYHMSAGNWAAARQVDVSRAAVVTAATPPRIPAIPNAIPQRRTP